jgi:hypothetical protein
MAFVYFIIFRSSLISAPADLKQLLLSIISLAGCTATTDICRSQRSVQSSVHFRNFVMAPSHYTRASIRYAVILVNKHSLSIYGPKHVFIIYEHAVLYFF